MTKLIDNAGFELGNTNYWTVGNSSDTGARSTNSDYAMSNSEGNYLFNTWWKGIPITQNVGKLPAGQYVLSAVVASDGARIYGKINDAHDYYVDTSDKTVGLPFNYVFTLDEEKEVTIGVVGGNDDEGKTYTEAGYWWYKADNFKLTQYVPVTGIEAEDITVEVLKTVSITATVLPDNASLPEITYTSGDEGIATVDADGVVTGVAEGTTTITLTADGVSTTINVTVEAPAILPESITIAPATITLVPGESIQVTATVSPEEAPQEVTFSSSDEDIVTIDAEGNIKAVGVGSATITATSVVKDDVTGTATVTVAYPDAPSIYSNEIENGKNYWFYNAATGKYLGGANGWGTRASLIEHGIPFKAGKVSDGVYELDSYTSNGGDSHYLAGEWIDGPATNLTFTKNTNGTFSIGLDGKLLQAKTSNTMVDLNGTDATDPFAQWYALSVDDRIAMLEAGTDDDATFLIKDFNFSRNNTMYSEWEWTPERVNHSNAGGDGEAGGINFCVESYRAAFNQTQEIFVPNGTYELTAQGFYRNDGGTTPPVFFANDEEQTFLERIGSESSMAAASESFSAGLYKMTNPIEVTVTDHILRIGAKCDNNGFWCIWDNFELKGLSVEADEVVEVSISAAGYATLYYEKLNLKIPSGITAYTVDKVNNKQLNTVELGSIPAGTGVLLEGETGDYTFSLQYFDKPTPAGENYLQGSDEEMEFNESGYKYYILTTNAKGDLSSVGFYYQVDGGTSVTNGAHKAFLKVPVENPSSETNVFLLRDQTDGITHVRTDLGGKEVYTLSGLRVNASNLPKGVYIVNGKKIIIK